MEGLSTDDLKSELIRRVQSRDPRWNRSGESIVLPGGPGIVDEATVGPPMLLPGRASDAAELGRVIPPPPPPPLPIETAGGRVTNGLRREPALEAR